MSLPNALPSIPTELALRIFQSFDSLSDVISLAAASRAWRCIWLEHTTTIYREIAPKCIEGEKHARHLQLSMSGNNDITPDDVLGIVRRASFVNNIIPQFEEKVVSKVKATIFSHYYDNKRRPKHLTATERRRFIRTYYQIWALIILDESSWQAHINAFSIKQIYLLREMSTVPLPIGNYIPDPEQMRRWRPHNWDHIDQGRRKRLAFALKQTIEAFIEQRKTQYHDPWFISKETWKHDGYAGFFLIWDHGKDELWSIALDRDVDPVVELSQEEAGYERKHRWAESSDEEGET